jgi:uncharacterized protein YbaR (Trm112 family)
MPDSFACPFCKKPFDALRMAQDIVGYNPAMHLHIARCPECRESVEFRARAGEMELGYTYWAGSMHFEAVATLPLRGFRPGENEGTLELDGKQIFAPA